MKTISKKSLNLFVISLLTFIQACTSTGPVEKVSSRLIDRPYTLPEGVAAWKIITSYGLENYHGSFSFSAIPPIPLFWEQSLNQNLTLEWGPLPLGIRYQILKRDSQILGTKFDLGILRGSGAGNSIIVPKVSLFSRTRLTQNTGIEINLRTVFIYKNNIGYKSTVSPYLHLGPIFQISNNFAIKPEFGLRSEFGSFDKIEEFDVSNKSYQSKLRYPLLLNFDWKLSDQWLFETEYEYIKRDTDKHNVVLTFSHFW